MELSKALCAAGSVLGTQRAAKAVEGFGMDDLLSLVGVRRRPTPAQSIMPVVGLLSLGAALGAGLALLFAPSTGTELRQRISERFDELTSDNESD
ncbi:MAG TPA: YtxH domain-containing protein [Polyangiaceae bacterium]